MVDASDFNSRNLAMEFFKSVLDLLNELEAESNRAIFGIGRIENSNK